MEIKSKEILLLLLKLVNDRIYDIEHMQFEFEDINRVSYRVDSVNDGTYTGMLMSLAISNMTGCMPEKHGTLKFRDTTSEEKDAIMKRMDSEHNRMEYVKCEYKLLKYLKEDLEKELNM